MLHRFFLRRAFQRYKRKTFQDDRQRLNELLLLYKTTSWVHNIYDIRVARKTCLPLWYMDAESLMLDLRRWHQAFDNEGNINVIALEERTYAILAPQITFNRWLADADGRVIQFDVLMRDVIEYGRILATWLDALAERDDLDAAYGLRKTRKLARDCCELLTFALSQYTGVL